MARSSNYVAAGNNLFGVHNAVAAVSALDAVGRSVDADMEEAAFNRFAKAMSQGGLDAISLNDITNIHEAAALGKVMMTYLHDSNLMQQLVNKRAMVSRQNYAQNIYPALKAAQDAYARGDMEGAAMAIAQASANTAMPFRVRPERNEKGELVFVEYKRDDEYFGNYARTNRIHTMKDMMGIVGDVMKQTKFVPAGAGGQMIPVNPMLEQRDYLNWRNTSQINAANLMNPRRAALRGGIQADLITLNPFDYNGQATAIGFDPKTGKMMGVTQSGQLMGGRYTAPKGTRGRRRSSGGGGGATNPWDLQPIIAPNGMKGYARQDENGNIIVYRTAKDKNPITMSPEQFQAAGFKPYESGRGGTRSANGIDYGGGYRIGPGAPGHTEMLRQGYQWDDKQKAYGRLETGDDGKPFINLQQQPSQAELNRAFNPQAAQSERDLLRQSAQELFAPQQQQQNAAPQQAAGMGLNGVPQAIAPGQVVVPVQDAQVAGALPPQQGQPAQQAQDSQRMTADEIYNYLLEQQHGSAPATTPFVDIGGMEVPTNLQDARPIQKQKAQGYADTPYPEFDAYGGITRMVDPSLSPGIPVETNIQDQSLPRQSLWGKVWDSFNPANGMQRLRDSYVK